MRHGYISLYSLSPRSFLFSVVANVGPGGASRTLAVAYRQGSDLTQSHLGRLDLVVQDILRMMDILSEPSNRAALEAERALAAAWYQDNGAEVIASKRPSVPDTPPPPFVVPDGDHRWEPQIQPEMRWDDSPREFPFTTTCLLRGLLRDDPANRTRPGDVQLQPLSTVFRGDCKEYGLIVLDISDLERVKYGIVAFPVHYMGEVYYGSFHLNGWDPVEDDPPVKEPDVLLVDPRPRVPLSIVGYIRKYFNYTWMKKDPNVLRLEDWPLIDAGALDYIWPPELEFQTKAPWAGVISSFSNYFWPSKSTMKQQLDFWPSKSSTTRSKEASSTAERLSTPHEPRNAQMDRAIDNLLIFTHHNRALDETTIRKFQKLTEFREQLRRRLEEVPDSLGPSEACGYILRVAYAGRAHLNWVAFRNLAPSVIAAAIASDELRTASALSLCVDEMKGDFGELGVAIAQSTSLKQLCFLQRPDRENDDASARFCTRLLGSSGNSWLRNKTIYSTCAFSIPLRLPPRPSTGVTSPNQREHVEDQPSIPEQLL